MSDPMGNNFFEGVLGVVQLTYDNVDLGKTLDEATLEFIEDLKDIFYAQFGTQPYDKIPTGQAYQLSCKLGEQTLARMAKLIRGFSYNGNSAKLGVDLYRSGRDNFSKVLEVKRVDSDGNASSNSLFRLYFYKAMPTINGTVANFGPDSQREFDVTFYIFKDATKGAFGFSGYASSVGL